MPKQNRNQHKKQQRALQKRAKRKQKLSRRQAQTPVPDSPRRLLRTARRMPVEGAWVQQGWQEGGTAQVLIARAQPNDDILFGAYLVDYLCTGIKYTSHAVNLSGEVFLNETIPNLYTGTPPLDISENLAHEIIWGAIEYAESLGFEPHRNFRESRRILEPADALPRGGAVEFGYQGKPLYIPAQEDNQAAIIRKLIDTVGIGNFYYLPRGDIPEEVADLLQIEETDDAPESEIWTPGSEAPGNMESQSGLWVPGQQPSEQEQPEQPLIWTPGTS